MKPHVDDTDYIKVQPKRFAPRANRETADGRFWRNLRFLEFERQYVLVSTSCIMMMMLMLMLMLMLMRDDA